MHWLEYMVEKAYHLHTPRWELLALKVGHVTENCELVSFVSCFFLRITSFSIVLIFIFTFYTLLISRDLQNIYNSVSDGI